MGHEHCDRYFSFNSVVCQLRRQSKAVKSLGFNQMLRLNQSVGAQAAPTLRLFNDSLPVHHPLSPCWDALCHAALIRVLPINPDRPIF